MRLCFFLVFCVLINALSDRADAEDITAEVMGQPLHLQQDEREEEELENLIQAASGLVDEAPAFGALVRRWEALRSNFMPDPWDLPVLKRLTEPPPDVRWPTSEEMAEQTAITRTLRRQLRADASGAFNLKEISSAYVSVIRFQTATWGRDHPVTLRSVQHYGELFFRVAGSLDDTRREARQPLLKRAQSMNRRVIEVFASRFEADFPPMVLAFYRGASELDARGNTKQAISVALTAIKGAQAHKLLRLEHAALSLVAAHEDDLKRTGLLRPVLLRLVDVSNALGEGAADWHARLKAVPRISTKAVFDTAHRDDGLSRLAYLVKQHERVLSKTHPEVVKLKQNVGQALLNMRSPAAAVPYLEDLAAFFSARFGKEDDLAIIYQLNLAEALIGAGRSRDAANRLNKIVAHLNDTGNNIGLFRAVRLKLRVLLSEGRRAAAIEIATKILSDASDAPPSLELAELLMVVQLLYFAEGQLTQAADAEIWIANILRQLGAEGNQLRWKYAVTTGLWKITDPLDRVKAMSDIYVRAHKVLGPYHEITRDALKWSGFHLVLMFSEYGVTSDDPRLSGAMALLDQGLSMEKEAPGDSPTRLGELLSMKAVILNRIGKHAAAVSHMRQAEAIAASFLQQRYGELGGLNQNQTRDMLESAAISAKLRWDLAVENKGVLLADLRDEAFQQVQTSTSSVAIAMLRATARGAGGDKVLSGQVRRLEEAIAERDALEGQLGGTKARVKLTAEIDDLKAGLSREYPEFFDLVMPSAIGIGALQGQGGQAPVLGENEALVLLIPGFQDEPGYIWAVSRDAAAWARLGVPQSRIEDQIKMMHGGLDITRVRGSFVLGEDLGNVRGRRLRSGYDRQLAYGIYKDLFGDPEIARVLSNRSNWIIVPRGGFLNMPFSALVTRPPEGRDDDPDALRVTGWLGLERALVVAPSVSGIAVSRRVPRSSVGSVGFFGLGDPNFSGVPADDRLTAGLNPAEHFFRDAEADIKAVRSLPRLPGTRREVESMAEILGADKGDLLLGDRATETQLARLNASGTLSHARIAVFATHGLVAGSFDGLTEPALAMSPPETGPRSVDMRSWVEGQDSSGLWIDDGLLKASEVAALSLNAEWVILSACDTASGASSGAEGLSGLAQAFLYAGARSLLVSHWPVDDALTARLTTLAVARAETNGTTRAEAFRAAMRTILEDSSNDAYVHPAYWAPFQLIGIE